MKTKKVPFRFTRPQLSVIFGLILLFILLIIFLLLVTRHDQPAPVPLPSLIPRTLETLQPSFIETTSIAQPPFTETMRPSPAKTTQPSFTETVRPAETPGTNTVTEEALQWTDLIPPTGAAVARIELQITVELDTSPALNCPHKAQTTVPSGAQLKVCTKVINTGNVPLVRHSFSDNAFFKMYPWTNDILLLPGQSYQIFSIPSFTSPATISGTWTAYTETGEAVSAEASVDITIDPPRTAVTEELQLPFTETPHGPPELEHVMIGLPLPDVLLTFDTVVTQSLRDLQPQTPMLININGLWCQPCVDMLPVLSDIQTRYPPDRLQIIAIMTYTNKFPIDWDKTRSQYKLGFPLAEDTSDAMMSWFDAVPVTLIVTSDFIVRDIFIGSKTSKELQKALEVWIPNP